MNKITVRLYEKRGYARGGLVEAAEAVRGRGRWGDEILVHVNPEEFLQMQQMWGKPSINPHTGLPEYGWLSRAWRKIKKAAKVVLPIALNFIPGVGTALSAGLTALGVGAKALPLATAIAKGAIGGGISGGGKGALVGAVTGGLGGGAGVASKLGLGTGLGAQVAGNALVSGAQTAAGGGDFGQGALYGGIASAALPYLNNSLAGTKVGQSLGLSNVPTLTSPGGLAALNDGLSEYTPVNGRVPELNIDRLSDGIQEVTVSAPRMSAAAPDSLSSMLGPIGPVVPRSVSVGANSIPAPDVGAVDPGPEPEASQPSFLARALGTGTGDALQRAVTLMALGGGFSGGPQGAQTENPPIGSVPGTQPGFNDPLPDYTFSRTRRPSFEDYYTYGQRPEQSFYDNNTTPRRMARGGALPVMGGRADTIDAKLSEGEYVIDAETVALLGDGSVQAGAAKLEKLRQNVRKHKGKALAKGKISPNAKGDVAAYMLGAK